MKKKIYILLILFFIVILAAGHIFIYDGDSVASGGDKGEYLRTTVSKIISDKTEHPYENDITVRTIRFKALVKSGERKGKMLSATQIIDSSAMYNAEAVSAGDKVIIYQSVPGDGSTWNFAEYIRSDAIIVLAVLLCIAIVIFGRMKGLKTLLSLILTVCSVFFVLIPAIFGGRNIYFWTIIVCLYITVMTLVTVNGLSFMSLVAGIGCMSGVLISALITIVTDFFIRLTGYTDECTIYIKGINNGVINLKALVFAGILVGSIGAVMDVAVNIAASLHEVASKINKPTFKELFTSGMTISRDIIGTMSNTLILAYIGSSLCSVLLVIYNNSFSMLNMFNKENIIVELLKILVGSFGIFSALPLTSAVSALFYSRIRIPNSAEEDEKDDFTELLTNSEKDS